MDWLNDNPYAWLGVIALVLIIAFLVILVVSYLFERLGDICEKFNNWVNDEIDSPSFIIYGILLMPVYVVTSFFGYLGKICYAFNTFISENSYYEQGNGWINCRKGILNFLSSILLFSFIITIMAIFIKALL
jgi:hypothetical protein